MGYVSIACATVLTLVFAISAGSKLRSRTAFRAFADSLTAMRFAPGGRPRPLAMAILTAEIGAIFPLLYPEPLGALRFVPSVALLAVLTVGVWAGVSRRVGVPCHCFGASATPVNGLHIVRNLLLVAVGVLGALTASVRDPVHVNGAIIAIAAGGLATAIIIQIEDIVMLFGTRSTE